MHSENAPVPDNPGDDLVMVGRFLDPTEAQMAKGMLDAAGIDSFLQGENANALYPMALRVRLEVRRDDEAAARALMADSGGSVAPGQEDSDLA
jgi:hypothetical protein